MGIARGGDGKFMIAAEAKWANSACSPQPSFKDVIADDFQGTSPRTSLRQGQSDRHRGRSRSRAIAN